MEVDGATGEDGNLVEEYREKVRLLEGKLEDKDKEVGQKSKEYVELVI